ncbi:MAG: hypothetical protein L0221_13085 [Chloroflexi bacterium]|nr:hypothetical protein [Chloroflexota bacterium]
MHDRLLRILLILLSLNSLIGLWAAFAPRSFYDDFPGGGRSWVSPDGPYNEHLVRDFGALNLALSVLTIAAAVMLVRSLAVTAALGWLAYSIPHLVYHLRHLDVYETSDQIANVTALALAPVLAIAVLVLEARSATRPGAA